jgi:hypothetical protein
MATSVHVTADLQSICTKYYNRINLLEADKYDLEWAISMRALEVKRTTNVVYESAVYIIIFLANKKKERGSD